MGWMVGLEVQVVVSVGGLPVDSDVQATILLPEKSVQEWESSIFLYLDGELHGGSHAVEVIQESFCLALLQNAACQHTSSRGGASLGQCQEQDL